MDKPSTNPNPAPQRTYQGACSHCRHITTCSRPGTLACKWGGCNGTVQAL